MKHDFTVIPFQGDEIKPQNFQSLREQPQTNYDIKKVNDKGFAPGQEIRPLLDNDDGKKILVEIGSAAENGHTSRCAFIVKQSTEYLNMAEPSQKVSFDYKQQLKQQRDLLKIPDELNKITRHQAPKPETPKPGKMW